ncbi:MAG: sulfatase-like hydrolase/transferase [Terriglobia bacterium]
MTKLSRPLRSSVLLVVVVFLLLAYKTLEASGTRWWGFPEKDPNATQAVLDRYAKYDISFQLARQIISPPQLDDSLFEFLTHHTNIPRSVHINPTDINFVENLQGNLGPRPHVFIFVIDSLRRDYLSPYNPAVRFTPAIQSLASDSLVFENAFTRYGGTGLSEPSLWVGGMLVHQQYVTPFAPMNALQKLLRAEQYRSFVSRDSILDTILSPWPALFDLDKGSATLQLDFCNTLHELKKNLADPKNQGAPIFAYTQPQNIHISVINREGKNNLDNDSYPGFYAPYASRIKRIDACLGEFVSFLKSSGLYEESIIILTADHGESLGEDGRWGHAYTIFPEVLRIPLILHLPAHLRPQSPADTKAVAFLTDVTPTLYALLGHRPSRSSEMLGRPLFTIGPVTGVRCASSVPLSGRFQLRGGVWRTHWPGKSTVHCRCRELPGLSL